MPYVNEKTGAELKIGDETKTGKGKPCKITSFGNDGLIYAKFEGVISPCGYYPSVYGAKWVRGDFSRADCSNKGVAITEAKKALAVAGVVALLNSMNIELNYGLPINGNARIAKAMELLEDAFKKELGIL